MEIQKIYMYGGDAGLGHEAGRGAWKVLLLLLLQKEVPCEWGRGEVEKVGVALSRAANRGGPAPHPSPISVVCKHRGAGCLV